MKKLFVLFGLIVVFFVSFMGNVYLHELGHYSAAESFDLNPSIKFENMEDSFNGYEMKALAYTEFDYTSDSAKKFVIVAMGPLVNLFLCVVFLFVYVYWRDSEMIKIIALAGLVPSLFSFIINILPFGGSDGQVIMGLLIG